jgi:hypothetical protein
MTLFLHLEILSEQQKPRAAMRDQPRVSREERQVMRQEIKD